MDARIGSERRQRKDDQSRTHSTLCRTKQRDERMIDVTSETDNVEQAGYTGGRNGRRRKGGRKKRRRREKKRK